MYLIRDKITYSAALLLLGWIGPVAAQSQIPPTELWWGGATMMTFGSGKPTIVRARTEVKRVTLSWRWFPTADDDFYVYDQQEFDVTYWPTYVTSIAANELCVAGKRRDGKTIIERWAFSNPETMSTPPGVPGGPGNPPAFAITAGMRSSVEVVYNQAVSGRDMVAQMVPMAGRAETTLLVRFWDSKDLYSVNLESGVVALLATKSISPPPGAISIPALAGKFHSLHRRTHLQHGYVYIFGTNSGEEGMADRNQDTLVVVDSNKDGDLDTYFVLDETGWEQLGFASAENYE